MGRLCHAYRDVAPSNVFADWTDPHVYCTTCEILATSVEDGARVKLHNTIVFGDPPAHRIVEWKIETRPAPPTEGDVPA